MRIIYLYVVCLLSTISLQSQHLQEVRVSKGLKVGDKVPDYVITNVINYPQRKVRLSDFKGKLLILDFWGTWCVACMQSWPKLLKLQSEFGDQLRVLLINNTETEETVVKAIVRRKTLGNINMNLPTSCGIDSSIEEIFPYSSAPHIVWIDKNGVLQSITEGSSLNSRNILNALTGNFRMPQKMENDSLVSFDLSKPLFVRENISELSGLRGYSIFAKADIHFRPGVSVISSPDSNNYYIGGTGDLRSLYRLAYSNRRSFIAPGINPDQIQPLMISRIILEVKDTTKYVDRVEDEYRYDNHYIYQFLSVLPLSDEKLQECMKADLMKYTGLQARWEKRLLDCFVLKAYDTSLIAYKSGGIKSMYIDGLKLNKVTVKLFISRLEDIFTVFYFGHMPIIDETGYSGLLGDINVDTDISDTVAFDKALHKYKMSLTIEKRLVDVLVISDSDTQFER